MSILPSFRDVDPLLTTVRIAVSGLARAGKTSFLTSVAVNLLAGNLLKPAADKIVITPGGDSAVNRFDAAANARALSADPPAWPPRTSDVSLLALDLTYRRGRLRPDRRVRLEFLDYPGEWLLDLPLLHTSYADWSEQTLRRLEPIGAAGAFLDFLHTIGRDKADYDAVAVDGSRRYRALLQQLSRVEHLSMLQPGRFLMPPHGEVMPDGRVKSPAHEPPYMAFFPFDRSGPFARLLAQRYDAYVRAVREELSKPSFARIDRMVVLADVLAALHAGQDAFRDVRAALAAVSDSLRWRNTSRIIPARLATLLPLGGIKRVAFVASKADHVGSAQRHNLKELVNRMTPTGGQAISRAFAVAAVRCTEDCTVPLSGANGIVNVPGVRGKVGNQMLGFFPGQVDPGLADDRPWTETFLQVPLFEPVRFDASHGTGIPNIGLQELLGFLLEDVV